MSFLKIVQFQALLAVCALSQSIFTSADVSCTQNSQCDDNECCMKYTVELAGVSTEYKYCSNYGYASIKAFSMAYFDFVMDF